MPAAAHSPGLLVALGAQIILAGFVAGGVHLRLQNVRCQLEMWLRGSRSVAFRFREARRASNCSEFTNYVTGKAVRDRAQFCRALCDLQEATDCVAYMRQLCAIVGSLCRPCLQLRLLRQILGLDGLFSLEVIFGVVILAFDIAEDIAGVKRPAVSGVFAADEATRLEADQIFKVKGGPSRDPIGEECRRRRYMTSCR